jgi:periplasmic protein TonB
VNPQGWKPVPTERAAKQRVAVVTLVVGVHLAGLGYAMTRSLDAPVPAHEMQVALLMPTVPAVLTPPQKMPAPTSVMPRRTPILATPQAAPSLPVRAIEMPRDMPVIAQPAPVVVAAVPVVLTPQPVAAPVVVSPPPVVEPDYQASYLNNPAPNYPLAARRLGLEGRVLLNVEVLAEGVCGQINLAKSSGHDMLDNAALQTVKVGGLCLPSKLGGRLAVGSKCRLHSH